MSDTTTEESKTDFRDEQVAEAAAQNQTAPNAVPETRPQAIITPEPSNSEIGDKLREAGLEGGDGVPMPKSAFDLANSDKQKEKAKKESRQEGIHAGSIVVATDGPCAGESLAVVTVDEYRNANDEALASGPSPEKRFVQPKTVTVRITSGPADGTLVTLDVDDSGLVKQNEVVGRGSFKR